MIAKQQEEKGVLEAIHLSAFIWQGSNHISYMQMAHLLAFIWHGKKASCLL